MAADAPLKHLVPSWYALVMGLAGLSLAWQRATPVMGDPARAAATAIGALAALVFVVLAVATVLRGMRHPDAWAEDRRHPVRHTFIAALPISLILLATVAVALSGPSPAAAALWWIGSLAQLAVTLWVLARWWREGKAGPQWASVTPALLIPIVGNVLVPLAGVPLGFVDWSAAQFGIGLMFWPLVLVLIAVRLHVQGIWPERMRPTLFILVAPPTVIGLAALQFGLPDLLAWGLWGMALFCMLWAGSQVRAIAAMAFSLPHWALSFPLAAFAALTLRLGGSGGTMAMLGVAALSLASLVIAWLLLGTLRGLRDGSLLAPEPVAAIQPVASTATG